MITKRKKCLLAISRGFLEFFFSYVKWVQWEIWTILIFEALESSKVLHGVCSILPRVMQDLEERNKYTQTHTFTHTHGHTHRETIKGVLGHLSVFSYLGWCPVLSPHTLQYFLSSAHRHFPIEVRFRSLEIQIEMLDEWWKHLILCWEGMRWPLMSRKGRREEMVKDVE